MIAFCYMLCDSDSFLTLTLFLPTATWSHPGLIPCSIGPNQCPNVLSFPLAKSQFEIYFEPLFLVTCLLEPGVYPITFTICHLFTEFHYCLSAIHDFKHLEGSTEFWSQTNLVEMAVSTLFSCVTCKHVNLFTVSRGEIRDHVKMPAPQSCWWRYESEITGKPLCGARHTGTLSSLGENCLQLLGMYSECVPGLE